MGRSDCVSLMATITATSVMRILNITFLHILCLIGTSDHIKVSANVNCNFIVILLILVVIYAIHIIFDIHIIMHVVLLLNKLTD